MGLVLGVIMTARVLTPMLSVSTMYVCADWATSTRTPYAVSILVALMF